MFDLSGLAQIAGVPVLQARNWTSGHPLHIRPSVRAASGKGTRNLYDELDAVRLAIANRLRDGAVAFRAIHYVIEKLDPSEFYYADADWLILSVSRNHISARAVTKHALDDELRKLTSESRQAVHHCAFLTDVVLEVGRRIKAYEREKEALR